MKTSFLPPKVDQLEKVTKGQSFQHDPSHSRNWEKAMDALHILFSHYPFYASIVTNTSQSFWESRILIGKLNLSRSKKKLPKELKDILSIKFNTFDALKEKIRNKTIWDSDGARDVWHFSSRWKEFPKGSKVIELFQKKNPSLFSPTAGFRCGLIVLDARCSVAEINAIMFNIKKVFESRKFTKRILSHNPNKETKTLTRSVETQLIFEKKEKRPADKKDKRTELVRGRGPATLLLLLQDNFSFHVRTITLEEKATLYAYFENLKTRGESRIEHEEMERKITSYFISKAKKKGKT